MLDQRALQALRGGGGSGLQQVVPQHVIEAMQAKEDTRYNVNVALACANSDVMFKHAVDGSENAREIISRSLALLVGYLRDVKIDGEDSLAATQVLEQAAGEAAADESVPT